jgi:PREDICTED: similar to AGAP007237-PA, partial
MIFVLITLIASLSDHPSIQMQIIASQSNLTLGDQLQLKCVVFGEQNPLITWSKLGNLPLLDNVQIAQNVLTIDKINAKNGGLYRCSTLTFSGPINRDYALYIYGSYIIYYQIAIINLMCFYI